MRYVSPLQVIVYHDIFSGYPSNIYMYAVSQCHQAIAVDEAHLRDCYNYCTVMYQCYINDTNQKHSICSLHLLHCHPDVTLCDRWKLINSTMDKEAFKTFDTCIHHGLYFSLSDETLICMSICRGFPIKTIDLQFNKAD